MYTMLYQVADQDGLRETILAYQKDHYEQFGLLPCDAIYNAAREISYKEWLYADEGSTGNEVMQKLTNSERLGKYIVSSSG